MNEVVPSPVIANDFQTYAGATVAGAVAGMRAMTAPALVSRLVQAGHLPMGHAVSSLFEHASSTKVTVALALGELVADKLPFTPRRTIPGALITRAVTGGLSGAAIANSRRRSPLLGALLGGAAAVGMAYAAYQFRKKLTTDWHIPDTLVALAEDAIAVGVGYSALRRLGVNEATA